MLYSGEIIILSNYSLTRLSSGLGFHFVSTNLHRIH
jgi:hypothetical protein